MRKINTFIVYLCLSICTISMFPMSLVINASNIENGKIIVSIGDSYSSGEGIEPFYGQNKNFDAKASDYDWLAHRSENCWPGMLTLSSVDGTMSENRGTNWFFVAASGAKTEHLLSVQKKEYSRLTIYGVDYLPAQLDIFDSLGDNKADYVTLTLGGNDAGFGDIVASAATGSTYLNFSNLADRLNDSWRRFYVDGGIRDSLLEAYMEISKKSGTQAKIIVVGYPKLLDQTGKGALFSLEEATLINDSVSNFNVEIENLVNISKASGIKICFVSVEDAFDGHEAYSSDPYINKLLPQMSEDLSVPASPFISEYSMHPNYKGARVYAKCVQEKINELEADGGKSEWIEHTTSSSRDIVLTLDVSGSMSGNPLEETKKASYNFINSILKVDASIGIVTYDSSAKIISDFNMNESYLSRVVRTINDGGGTNIEAGLSTAYNMLQKSNAEKKVIVLMSDGEPNDGKIGDELIAYANEIKNDGIYIYTLGFFANDWGGKSSAQALMEAIASDGGHFEVADTNVLTLFFGDVADQINGQKYIYIRIGCPADVSVSYNGEILNSSADSQSIRTSFGTLTFEESAEQSINYIKVLRLKEDGDYKIHIEGTSRGKMDYSIGFMDEMGEYSDIRRFHDIPITRRTIIDTTAQVSNITEINVDEDGDGRYDIKYQATENGIGEVVDYAYLYWAIVVIAVLVIFLVLVAVRRKSRVLK